MATTTTTSSATESENVPKSGPKDKDFFHASAPKAIVRQFRGGDESAAHRDWAAYLAKRKQPVRPDALLAVRSSPLGWALPKKLAQSNTGLMVRLLNRLGDPKHSMRLSAEDELPEWLADTDDAPAEMGLAIESLAWCRALPSLAGEIPGELWWKLFNRLVNMAGHSAGLGLSSDPVLYQLFAGELPLTLAYLFPEIQATRSLGKPARSLISRGIAELLDGEGMPHSSHLRHFSLLMASWIRCRLLGKKSADGCFNKTAEMQYQWAISAALRLTRLDGTQMLLSEEDQQTNHDMLHAACDLDGDAGDRRLVQILLPTRRKSEETLTTENKLIPPAYESEWAGVATMRPRWSQAGLRLAIAYGDRKIYGELDAGRDVLINGDWEYDVRSGGQTLGAVSDWEQLCWESDQDVDYLELEIHLEQGFRLQRQFLLARKDQFFFTADAILAEEKSDIAYRSTFPLGKHVQFEPQKETRDGLLVGGKTRASVLPLALPEWRAEKKFGELTAGDGMLHLEQSANAQRLYVPLLFDLNRSRAAKQLTWRQLSVAENREVLPTETVVAYRVQLNQKQWLIYRSLGEQGNRTVLSHNLTTEFLFARFGRRDVGKTLIEVE